MSSGLSATLSAQVGRNPPVVRTAIDRSAYVLRSPAKIVAQAALRWYLTAEGEFIWVPSHEDGGLHEFTVRVTDSGATANWSETTFTIEVNAR